MALYNVFFDHAVHGVDATSEEDAKAQTLARFAPGRQLTEDEIAAQQNEGVEPMYFTEDDIRKIVLITY